MPYAFRLDASSCSGCKACEVACRDRNALPAGVHWRRVYEVSGGGWHRDGEAWRSDVFAYHLSLSCNHCERPICVEVCPTAAMRQRADGLVLLDPRRCVGCRYCEWACPYGAPQFDAAAGVMSKCTGCVEAVAAGLPPACVAACGLRSLEFGEVAAAAAGAAVNATSPPLPPPELTRPRLLLVPHPHAARAGPWGRVANLEEVHAAGTAAGSVWSLVAFTLLVQAAVGLYWAWLALRWGGTGAGAPPDLPLFVVGPLLLAGMLASLLHLGRPHRAWRALANLRTSWLSREILLTLLFGAGWLVSVWLARSAPLPASWLELTHLGVALIGLGLVSALARVYMLRTVPAWRPARTFRGFLLTALVLGALGAALLLRLAPDAGDDRYAVAAWFALAAVLAVVLRARFYARYARSLP